jgi:hypothetical protein
MIGFIDPLITQLETTDNYNAITNRSHFTVHRYIRTRFSAFTSRILAKDFISPTATSNHTWSLIFTTWFFLSIFYNCQFRRLDSIQFLCSHAHILAAGVSKLDSILLNWTLLYNYFARTTQRTQPVYCWEVIITASLHRNGSYLIVACIFFAAGICLPSPCLAMNVYSDFAIPAFGRHLTVWYIELSGYCWKAAS